MTDWLITYAQPLIVVAFGVAWLLGYALSCLDYEQKIDEGRDINRRVMEKLQARAEQAEKERQNGP